MHEQELDYVCQQTNGALKNGVSIFKDETVHKRLMLMFSWKSLNQYSHFNSYILELAMCTKYVSTLPNGKTYYMSHVYEVTRQYPGSGAEFGFQIGVIVPKENIRIGDSEDDEAIIELE